MAEKRQVYYIRPFQIDKSVILGADHAGVEMKEWIKKILDGLHIQYEDMGSYDEKSTDDYPTFARKVARAVVQTGVKGILVCGSGTGMAIAANKVNGVRASFAFDTYSAKMARRDNDANVLTLRGREFPKSEIKIVVETWLSTPFSGLERHRERIEEVRKLEDEAREERV